MSADAAAGGGLLPDLLEELDALPFEPARRGARHYWWIAKSGLDFVAHNLPRWNAFFVRVNPYPPPWEDVRVRMEDGAALGGRYARGRPGAPAILYAPGTFQTKDDTLRKARAIRMWRELGYHVLVVDLRGFGESHAHWGTGGHLEARDLLVAARWLADRAGVPRVALMGDSLGGASALIASALPEAPDVLSCTLAWSPFADLREQLEYSATNPGVRHPYFVPYHLYRFMVYARSSGRARGVRDYMRLRAETLGLTEDELLRLSSPAEFLRDVRVPTLVHHAIDDPIVPVAQARRLEAAARGNPWVRVRVLPEGGHATFDVVAPDWFGATVAATVARHHAPQPPPSPAAPEPSATAHDRAGVGLA